MHLMEDEEARAGGEEPNPPVLKKQLYILTLFPREYTGQMYKPYFNAKSDNMDSKRVLE